MDRVLFLSIEPGETKNLYRDPGSAVDLAEFFTRKLGWHVFFTHRIPASKWKVIFPRMLKVASKQFIFIFVGHGGQTPDLNGDEGDGMDETLCFAAEPGDDIATRSMVVDDWIFDQIAKTDGTVKLTLISGSCRSGSVFDLQNKGKRAPRNICSITAIEDHHCLRKSGSTNAKGNTIGQGNLFIDEICVELKKDRHCTPRQIVERINKTIRGLRTGGKQIVQLASTHPASVLDRPILEDPIGVPTRNPARSKKPVKHVALKKHAHVRMTATKHAKHAKKVHSNSDKCG
jgi:hypothetical protein